MDRQTLRKTTLAAALALPVLLVSCNRQSAVERKEPVAQQKSDQSDAGATNQTPQVGTSGNAAAPATQDTAASAAPQDTTAAADTSSNATTPGGSMERDPDAIKALEDMGRYLRTLNAFQIRSQTTRDTVLDDGQNVTTAGDVDMIVARPNRMRAEVTNDKQERMYFSDGKTFSVWARRVNYYATAPAPPTLRELADKLADRYNIELPVADLFYWGDRKNTDEIKGAIDVGPSQVDGVTCEHYAFRQDGADWQVWIQQGEFPLPRKLLITTTTDPSRPRYSSVMTWNLAPSFNDAAFEFVPPRDAKRIMLGEVPTGDSQ